MKAAVSPDGTKIAFGTREGTELFLNIQALATGEIRRLKVGEDEPLPNDFHNLVRPAQMRYLAWASNERIVFKPDAYALSAVGTDLSEPVSLLRHHIEGNESASLEFEAFREVKAINPADPDWILVEVKEHGASSVVNRTTIDIAPYMSGIRIIPGRGGVTDLSYSRTEVLWGNVLNGNIRKASQHPLSHKTTTGADGSVRGSIRPTNLRSKDFFYYEENGSPNRLDKLLADNDKPTLGLDYDRKNGRVQPPVTLQNFGHHPDWIFYTSAGDEDTRGLYSLNIKTLDTPNLLFQDPRFDMGEPGAYFDEDSLLHCDSTRSPAGIRYQAEKATTAWIQKELAAAQSAIDTLRPSAQNTITSWSDDLSVLTVESRWQDSPSTFYVYSDASGEMEKIADNGELRVVTVPVWIPTADGRQLLCYLSLPKESKPGIPNRTVVTFPTDPMSRHVYDLPDESRMLAESGYTVLRVNARGLPGLGKSHFEAGAKQLGVAAAEDVKAALEWCFARKISTPGDVYAMGSGFGGLLALNVAAKDPENYKGIIAISPLTELSRFIKEQNLEADYDYEIFSRPYLAQMFGNPKGDKSAIDQQSPIAFADKLRCPVLLIHGFEDETILPHHSENLFNKIKKRSSESRLIIIKEAGHLNWSPDQLEGVYGAALDFLSN